ncbi:MAG: hypothetical protein LBD03_05525 [Methanobrevibacter sp.]|nr:hypothetical protein [Candidatus Methanovirga procula]
MDSIQELECTIFWIYMLKIIDPKYPVACMDEKPKQLLLDNNRKNIPMNIGSPERYDYEYKRNCKVNIFVAVDYQKLLCNFCNYENLRFSVIHRIFSNFKGDKRDITVYRLEEPKKISHNILNIIVDEVFTYTYKNKIRNGYYPNL